jgi:hypothetical protein
MPRTVCKSIDDDDRVFMRARLAGREEGHHVGLAGFR